MQKLFALLIVILGIFIGLSAGLAAKLLTKNSHATTQTVAAKEVIDKTEVDDSENGKASKYEYVKLNNQFIVPLVEKSLVGGLIALSLSVEVETGTQETVYSIEPKLRDAFLQVLFDHANMGGFDGMFTNSNNMEVLRKNLLAMAQKVLGKSVHGVLITDIARQDM